MANRIKGITVEINGDTTKLSKALEGVNKNMLALKREPSRSLMSLSQPNKENNLEYVRDERAYS